MKGILVISHGELAKGMVNSASLFFGNEIEQIGYLCIQAEDNPDEFGAKIEEAIKELDNGDGVIILADLFGGTPNNQALKRINDTVDLICGANLGMLLETLGQRCNEEIDLEALAQAGKDGIVNIKEFLKSMSSSDDE